MSFTRQLTAPARAWVLVAGGGGDCLVQLSDPGPVEVYRGVVEPTFVEPRDYGVLLYDQGLQEIAFDLDETTGVWIASRHEETNRVVVSCSGTDPNAVEPPVEAT